MRLYHFVHKSTSRLGVTKLPLLLSKCSWFEMIGKSSMMKPMNSRNQVEITTKQPLKHMGVSKNRGTPKSSILIRLSIIKHAFWGVSLFLETSV